MPRITHSNAQQQQVDIFDDHPSTSSSSPLSQNHHSIPHPNTATQNRGQVLGDIDINTSQRPPNYPTTSVNSLTSDLNKLQLKDTEQKYHQFDCQPLKPIGRPRRARSSVDTESFEPLEAVQEEAELKETQSTTSTITCHGADQPDQHSQVYQDFSAADFDGDLPADDAEVQDVIERHLAGQYDWVLALPAPTDSADCTEANASVSSDGAVLYGCNVLMQTTYPSGRISCQGEEAPGYRLLATPLVGDEYSVDEESSILVKESNMAALQAAPVISPAVADRKSPGVIGQERMTPNKPLGQPGLSMSPDSADELKPFITHTPTRSASASVSRIEDSVEALDELEEALEAVDAATHIERVVSPDKLRTQNVPANLAAKARATIGRSGSTTRKPAGKVQSNTVRLKPTDSSRQSLRKSTSMIFSIEDDVKDADQPAEDKVLTKEAPKRFAVTRPASLLPPKPPAKSTKAPTKSTFELPGEAVARRLKEQREARLSLQINAVKGPTTTATPTLQRARSTRTLARPTFELPGEAISRRKKEEREAKLKLQDEQEKQRREFKARPIRNSIAPANFPRETITSRARQGRAVSDENVPKRANSVGGKRASVLVATPEALSTLATRSPQLRGREALQSASVQDSRATSTSTGSISGQRSTLSAEEAQQQKLRGQHIFQRDNSYTGEREREKRGRELVAKTAREQAAERSRQASREWAEKQRLKQLAAVGSVGSMSPQLS